MGGPERRNNQFLQYSETNARKENKYTHMYRNIYLYYASYYWHICKKQTIVPITKERGKLVKKIRGIPTPPDSAHGG